MMNNYQSTIFHQFGNFLRNTIKATKSRFKKVFDLISDIQPSSGKIKFVIFPVTHNHIEAS